jgi:prophage antirepressor-like protein
MSTGIVPFVFDGHEVRTVTINCEPWFVVADACSVLAIQNPRDAVAKNLPKADVAKINVSSVGQGRKMWVTNEPGLYRLILRSYKPDAERFQDWICREVLPSIRKTGQFSFGVPMLALTPTKWRKEFPLEFYQEIFRLKGKVMPENLATEPWLAQTTIGLIYERLADSLWSALQKANPTIGKWRKTKLHQHIADGPPKERLRLFIAECIGSMGSFSIWSPFSAHWDGRHPVQRDLPSNFVLTCADGQLFLPFAD